MIYCGSRCYFDKVLVPVPVPVPIPAQVPVLVPDPDLTTNPSLKWGHSNQCVVEPQTMMIYCGSGSYFDKVLVPVPIPAQVPVPVPDPDLLIKLLTQLKIGSLEPVCCGTVMIYCGSGSYFEKVLAPVPAPVQVPVPVQFSFLQ
jgi:hypothetical protein